jgi:predicted RNase H-like nuclease (RuvC/YqgF family)
MRKETVIMTVSIERELALTLKRLAREYGISVSQLVERLIIEALGSRASEPAKPQIPSDPLSPSEAVESGQQDPLLQLEVEEFESKLSRMERKAEELEQVVSAVAKGHFVRTGFEPHTQALRNRVFSLIDEWHEQKRWFYRLKRDLSREKASEFSRRLAQLKKRLNALLELLSR